MSKLDKARLQFNIQRSVTGSYYDVQVCTWRDNDPIAAYLWYRDLTWMESQDVIEATMDQLRLGEVLDDSGWTQKMLF